MSLPNFKDQVIDLVRRVPPGRLVSYGQVARVLGRPRASRVVGGVLNALPLSDRITPWQRVVNREGGVSHRVDPFSDVEPVTRQHELLVREGLEIGANGCYDLQDYGMTDSELRQLFDEEMLDLVDEKNQVIGICPRSIVRRDNLLHRGVGILCWNNKGELYVHQRTATKDVFPSCYDMMVGGAVEAGEPYDLSAQREVAEELGITDAEPQFLLECLYKGPKNWSYIHLFEVTTNCKIVHQEEEICWGRWMPFEKVLTWVSVVDIVPDGAFVFQQYLDWRKTSPKK